MFLCIMDVDYLIIGQGISGTLLSRNLIKEGRTVLVIDDGHPFSSSMVAGGIINPVTGMRMVRTWLIDELLPLAWKTYKELEQELNIPLIRECNILEFHANQEMSRMFADKMREEEKYLHDVPGINVWEKYFRFNYGIGEVAPCLLLDINAMLNGWRKRLKEMDAVVEEKFSWEHCVVKDNRVVYKNITAQKIICCEGAGGTDSPYFNRLPWSKDKGEAIIASIPGLPRTHIYKQVIGIVPWKEDLFWIGATHDWKFTDLNITAAFRKSVTDQLDYWLKLPYTIVDHIAAQRPSNVERRPFVGLHPVHRAVGILNGMGGKGVSTAPYFAGQLAMHLVNGAPILPEADVNRFRRVLSR